MISETRIRTLAREQGVAAGLAEKNYVNSWILDAVYTEPLTDALVFKGGTALSKLYFPEIWRFSEDLDFTAIDSVPDLQNQLTMALASIESESGITFTVTDVHEAGDPVEYVQVDVQYSAVLGQRNTTRMDITLDEPLAFPPVEHRHVFEDVPAFTLTAYSLAEILVEKLRSLYQKPRARHYYDLYHLLEQESFDDEAIVAALREKSRVRGLDPDLSTGLPHDDVEEVRAYWDEALDRLVREKPPPFEDVVKRIDQYLIHLADFGA